MKINRKQLVRRQGFTLIEMVGVLAVIAILAALLLPKIFAVINESRINNAATSFNSVKTASMSYFGKYGRFGGIGGTNLTGTFQTTNWDRSVLLPEGFIEKPFDTKIGNGTNIVEIIADSTPYYDFDGNGTDDVTNASQVIQARILGVSSQDAKDLNDRVDGTTLGAALAADDTKGRVYFTNAASGTVDVLLYIAHK